MSTGSSGGEPGLVRPGSPRPLGAHAHGDGVNFALFSRHATWVWLAFFDQAGDAEPARVMSLDPARHRTGDVWHVWVQGVQTGQLYGYLVDGPYLPQVGHRFNRHKLLLDPSASAVSAKAGWDFGRSLGYDPDSPEGDLSFSDRDNAAAMPKCIVIAGDYDWEGDQPIRRRWSETIIYEAHVRGLTIHPSAGAAHPGTYQGLVEKLPYLQDLGVTAVELLPVHEFNASESDRVNAETGERLTNYWGYNTVSFLAPKASYCAAGGLGQQVPAFKDMVKACHRAGIEVILDVVFNHTAEGNERGPTLSFRGLDNAIYYLLDANPRYYRNYTGTGNTMNANHPVVRDFVLEALRYWVIEMHVDGFRFDLASVLDRDEQGNLLPDAPLLERIAEDPVLRQTKLIAEAWDAAGAYQVGSFSEARWAEWNGRYRDDVRRFWRGDAGMVGPFASRIAGSSDIYQRSGKGPESSVNYIACHDGFTLNDLVSYAEKHNAANGEDNRDGTNDNYSANCGAEGQTDDPRIESLRVRQIKNFLVTLFISRGVPMLLGGDEFRRTQQGNNNAYCQDNEISWVDWTLLARHEEIHRFCRGLIAFRQSHPALTREAFYTADDIGWFDPKGAAPDWSDPDNRCLACLIRERHGPDLYLMFNASAVAADFALPRLPASGGWRRVIDTAQPTAVAFSEADGGSLPPDLPGYLVGPQACVILEEAMTAWTQGQESTAPIHNHEA